MIHQLALQLQLNYQSSLADFCWGENLLLQQQTQQFLQINSERFLYVWGPSGSGKSHYLQGLCQLLSAKFTSVMYLPLAFLKEWGADCLEDIDKQSVVAIDDVDSVAGSIQWEEALFHLYNKIKDNNRTKLVISAKSTPLSLPLTLPDLRSRLAENLIIQLHELSDELKIKTLQAHATKRGFDLPVKVAFFLITHYERNMSALFKLLDRLDGASLAAQRKITIPFVKAIIGGEDTPA